MQVCDDDIGIDEQASNSTQITTTSSSKLGSQGPSSQGHKRKKSCCGCSGCSTEDCGCCKFCLDMPRFGGPGKKKKRCINRACKGIKEELRPAPAAKKATQLSDITNTQSQLSQPKNQTVSHYTAEEIMKVLVFVLYHPHDDIAIITGNLHTTPSIYRLTWQQCDRYTGS